MIRRIVARWPRALAVAFGLAAAASARRSSSTSRGPYQGKPDQPPFAGAPWNGNKTEWDVAIRTRNQSQNEYKRTN